MDVRRRYMSAGLRDLLSISHMLLRAAYALS